MGMVEADCYTNDGDEELTCKHAKGAPDENKAPAEALHGPEGKWGGEDIYKSKD